MLSGIQEILVIIVILLAILFIPRMMSPQRRPQASKKIRPLGNIRNLSARWRLAIVVSLLWLLGTAVCFRPWQGALEAFLLFGGGPVILGWCIAWVVAGCKSGKKN